MSFSLLDRLVENFELFPVRNAFYIQGVYYTYGEFREKVAAIQSLILSTVPAEDKYIGLFTFDDVETYAAIYAAWFSGKAYIPLNPGNPAARNESILRQTGITYVLHSLEIPGSALTPDSRLQLINTFVPDEGGGPEIIPASPGDDFYVLFTSGSTGEPKGVPISRRNLNAFVSAFIRYGYDMGPEDRFLQIYDLSFDASVHCYTVPLTLGACVYTVPRNEIKYLYAYRLMQEHRLTFVKMPPSTLAYLKPYFSSIRLEDLKYCLLGGEAFPVILAEAWAGSVPNARIQNVYGPTEATINCLIFDWHKDLPAEKSYGGIVSIGRTFGDNAMVVVDHFLKPVPPGRKGELCIAGDQVTRGYWNDPARTAASFFEMETEGRIRRYYRTGDLVFVDDEGDVMFCGRIDNQVQIHGYRVELGEIEKHARDVLAQPNAVAIATEREPGATEIFLFIEDRKGREEEVREYLVSKLPPYMIPARIINLDELPKLVSGKIDRRELYKKISP